MKLTRVLCWDWQDWLSQQCSNEDEGNDILTKGTKQISVTISAGSYGQTKAGSGWTEDADKAINPQNIKLYLLKADGNIVEVKDAQVGSDNVYHNVSPEVLKLRLLPILTRIPHSC